jgi:hypothetical protein
MERAQYEGSLIEFFKRAWREIAPAALKLNWHHEVIAEHLEAVSREEIKQLLINIPPGCTKALAIDTPVLTTWGWKRHGDLAPGDFVFGPDGIPKRVEGRSPVTRQRCYRVKWDDGATLVASGDHLWTVERDYPYGGPGARRNREAVTVTTVELIKTIAGRNPRAAQRPDRIAVSRPLSLPPRQLLIDP